MFKFISFCALFNFPFTLKGPRVGDRSILVGEQWRMQKACSVSMVPLLFIGSTVGN